MEIIRSCFVNFLQENFTPIGQEWLVNDQKGFCSVNKLTFQRSCVHVFFQEKCECATMRGNWIKLKSYGGECN
jgi:hypothetical protein